MQNPSVLVVDDEPDLVELVQLTLTRMNIRSVAAGDITSAKAKLAAGQGIALCLTDMRLPDGDGLDLVEWIDTHQPQVPVAVITAHGNVETAVRALKAGAFDFVAKPLDLGALRRMVSAALRLSGASDSSGSFNAPRLTGQSAVMQRLREMIARVARSQAPVHISGESGTGKELVARLIHESGARSQAPFIAVNCGAIPSELMESELFGHKRGSFTGAVTDKKGLIQSAEGGTLFLDEVADLPLNMQVKLLRVIQEKSVRPVGETTETPIDVRLLSATHRHLGELVAAGRFREDLYYRINVIELAVPALRERREDIPELARSLLAKLCRRLEVEPPQLTAAALQLLTEHAYPGNVRELENVLERALTLASGGFIDARDIQMRAAPRPAQTVEPAPPSIGATPSAPKDSGPNNGATTGALGDQLESMERDAIVRALEETRYNKTAAARKLGITFRALRYRIKKLGIE
ncbi:MAG: sigma-54 dependent transcriptional regulator [Steroidobacteraceae bacterium]